MPATAVRRALMLHGDLAAVAGDRAARRPRRASPRSGSRSAARSRRCSRAPRPTSRPRWRRRRPPPSTTSSTARACRCTATATTSRSTRARSTTSPRGCPRSSPVARALPARALVLDGEAIALRADGRPEPFQVTASRFGTRGARDRPARVAVLRRAARRRRGPARRAAVARAPRCSPRSCRDGAPDPAHARRRTPRTAQAAFDAALAAGHEGVVVKALDAPYAAGRRGAAWLKVKPVHTLDLVVLAAEWGHGRRQRQALEPAPRRARRGDRRLGDARQDVQGPDRRAARVADRAAARAADAARGDRRPRAPRARRRDRVRRACRRPRATRPGWRCASRASSATARTSRPPRPTRSPRCGRSIRRRHGCQQEDDFDFWPARGTIRAWSSVTCARSPPSPATAR